MAMSTLLPSSSWNVVYYNNNKHYLRSHNLSLHSNLTFTISKLSLPVLGTSNAKSKRNYIVCNNGGQPGVPSPSGPPSNSLKGWIVGIILSILLPSFRGKLGPWMQLKNTVDSLVETVEDIADGIEKVAEVVDKAVEEIVDDLPEGKLKDAAKFVENMAEKIDKSAEKLGDMIDKAQEIEDKVEEKLESIAKLKKDEATKSMEDKVVERLEPIAVLDRDEASKPVEAAA
ncbi:PREDICTED: uncharacterized protein LOC109169725 [Ipomoea nil]|uniref:uncharacterized protein LOC109169725 n=1 Tax=Ipomoea nil TaxID=35883 RepID=UPI0009011C7F|nr:PREDICTED: uncharacterized protein LOC109169725 [Ipomoea nil]